MGPIDLHVHTTFSDGTDTPEQVVRLAAELGLSAIAVTDHDTVSGYEAAVAAGLKYGVEIVSGVEVSSDYRDNNAHVLGYFVDPASEKLNSVLEWIRHERRMRNRRTAELLYDDGFGVTMEELEAMFPNAIIGRPHFAELLMKKGFCESVSDGFAKYVGVGKKYYLPKNRLPIAEAVDAIRAAGGIAVLAHPLEYKYPLDEVEEMIRYAASVGVTAVECFYSEYTPEQWTWLAECAERHGLGITGGSDYHGSRKEGLMLGTGRGELRVPHALLDGLKKLRQ